MRDVSLELALWILIWIMASFLIVRAGMRRPGIGLLVAYVVSLSYIHLSGALVYLDSSFRNNDPETVLIGFRESAIGLVAFAFGAMFIAPLLAHRRETLISPSEAASADRSPALTYFVIGMLFFFASTTLIGRLPSATALLIGGAGLGSVGLSLFLWRAWTNGKWMIFYLLLGYILIQPAVSVVTQGFLGLGLGAIIVFGSFVSTFYRPRWRVVIGGTVVLFVGLSVFVTYMRDRAEIRDVVWASRPLAERLDRTAETFLNFELFDPGNQDHLQRVDERMNQNVLVGLAARRLPVTGEFLDGKSIIDSILGLVPRALWPNKPITGGSGDLVGTATGLRFNTDTSVGVGHILEFYANFGRPGVLFGLGLFGVLVALLDQRAGLSLRRGDWQTFSASAVVGYAFLLVGGSLFELIAGGMAALLVVTLVNHFFLYRLHRPVPHPGSRKVAARLEPSS